MGLITYLKYEVTVEAVNYIYQEGNWRTCAAPGRMSAEMWHLEVPRSSLAANSNVKAKELGFYCLPPTLQPCKAGLNPLPSSTIMSRLKMPWLKCKQIQKAMGSIAPLGGPETRLLLR